MLAVNNPSRRLVQGKAALSMGVAHALDRIKVDTDDNVHVKPKSLRKFGRNTSLSANVKQMVWLTGGIEVLPTANTIDTIVSDAAGDNQNVLIEGFTLSGGDLTFVSQTTTLNGTTNVSLGTPLARATRLVNTGATDFAGTVTVFVDGGSTHLTAIGDNNQSLKAATSISKSDYWIVTSVLFSVKRSGQAIVDFELEYAPVGGVFRTQATASVSSDLGTVTIHFDPPLIVPKNHDVRITAESSANSTQVDAIINGYLAAVQST